LADIAGFPPFGHLLPWEKGVVISVVQRLPTQDLCPVKVAVAIPKKICVICVICKEIYPQITQIGLKGSPLIRPSGTFSPREKGVVVSCDPKAPNSRPRAL